MIELQDVSLSRGSTHVFDRLNFRVTERRLGLIGDNGAGKTSLLRLLCGLEQPTQGHVCIDGLRIDAPRDAAGHVGVMFQNPDEQIVFPTVEEELSLGLRARGMARQEARKRVHAQLAGRGLAHWAPRAVASLSQGQRHFLCWLTLLTDSSRLLLLDEPFASLDLPSRSLLEQEIRDAPQQVVLSTHTLEQVRSFERVIWLAQGAIHADGPGREVCEAYEAAFANGRTQGSRGHAQLRRR